MQILNEIEKLGKRMQSAAKRGSPVNFAKHIKAIYQIAKAAESLLKEGKKLGYELLPVDEPINNVLHIEASRFAPGVATRTFCLVNERHEFLTVKLPVQKPSDVDVETWIGPKVLEFVQSLGLDDKLVSINGTAFKKMAETIDDNVMKACVVSESKPEDRLLFTSGKTKQKKVSTTKRSKA